MTVDGCACGIYPQGSGTRPKELGVHIRTSYRWCWWLPNAALSYEMQRQLEGTVEKEMANF